MYLLTTNEAKTVVGCAFIENIAEPPNGYIEVSWADYLTILNNPNHPYKYENNQLVKLDAPSAYHIWSNFQWVIDEANLANIRKDIWENIKKYWFHSDIYAQSNYTDLLMMGNQIPPNTYWKTMSGVFVTMTQTLAQQILGAKAVQKANTFAKAEQHKAAMQASADPLNYNYTTGWPLIYGE